MYVLKPTNIMIRTPTRILITGASGSGKIYFTQHLLRQLQRVCPPNQHYCYGSYQPLFDEMKKQDGVHFREGVPTLDDLKTWFTPKQRGLLVIDDLIRSCGNGELVVDIFTKHSHHSNITVCYLIQDLFLAGKYAKIMNRNTHYMAVVKNPRDKTGIRGITVLLQAFPSPWQEALTLFQEARQQPFGYFWLELHPALDDRYRLWTNNILDKDFPAIVYEQILV